MRKRKGSKVRYLLSRSQASQKTEPTLDAQVTRYEYRITENRLQIVVYKVLVYRACYSSSFVR